MKKKVAKVEIEEINDKVIARLFVNDQLKHSVFPQCSRSNAIMLINRAIDRFNAMNGTYFKHYKDSKNECGLSYLRQSSPNRRARTSLY
ncbi:hypothetical protein [Haemophilus haemolyticus]|uniref:hypothetical protein n=1 Tax=Haemophilus haemolyticus TaxID=726 RepID=UPI000E584CC8|nr:hypothetical protein [Haemophilus haemolyticus]